MNVGSLNSLNAGLETTANMAADNHDNVGSFFSPLKQFIPSIFSSSKPVATNPLPEENRKAAGPSSVSSANLSHPSKFWNESHKIRPGVIKTIVRGAKYPPLATQNQDLHPEIKLRILESLQHHRSSNVDLEHVNMQLDSYSNPMTSPHSVQSVSSIVYDSLAMSPSTPPPSMQSAFEIEDLRTDSINSCNSFNAGNVQQVQQTASSSPLPQIESPLNMPTSASLSITQARVLKFRRLLNEDKCDIGALRKLSWSGIPSAVRRETWQILMCYLPLNFNRRESTLERKRREYYEFVQQQYTGGSAAAAHTETEQGYLKQILLDVPRTHPETTFFRLPIVQLALERILFIWSVRHPASGYVQGINDLATPFMLLFYTDSVGHDSNAFSANTLNAEQLLNFEADSFWCLTKLLDGIQDNYIFSQPGIQRAIYKLRELIHRIDGELCQHLEIQDCQFIQFAFRWMNNLLMREMSVELIIRLWDTYLSEEDDDGFSVFHTYVTAAFLMRWKVQLKELEFQDLIMFIQHPPTGAWTAQDIETLVGQAFVYKTLYHYAPNHLH